MGWFAKMVVVGGASLVLAQLGLAQVASSQPALPGGGGMGFDLPGLGLGSPGGIAPELLGPVGQPATQPASTEPSGVAKVPDFVSKDPLYLEASTMFHDADYRGCMEKLRTALGSGVGTELSVESRQLYIAALVANNQLSLASFQAVQSAKVYPKTFFVVRPLAGLLRDHPDFADQYDRVKSYCKEPTTLEPGILWAMYQQLHGADDMEVRVTLDLLHPKEVDKVWYNDLLASVKTKPETVVKP